MIRKLKQSARIAAALALSTLTLGAQAAPVLLSQNVNITASGAGSVAYVYFTLNRDMTLDIYTTSLAGTTGIAAFNPEIFLFVKDGPLDADDLLPGVSDVDCPTSLCGSAYRNNTNNANQIGAHNALIDNVSLEEGNYVLAISDDPFDRTEAVGGQQAGTNSLAGGIQVRFAYDAADGAAITYLSTVAPAPAVPVTPVPAPASLALLGIGLLALGAAKRRRA